MMHHALSRRSLLGAAVSAPVAGWLAGCGGSRPATGDGGPPEELTYLSNFGTLGRDSYAWLAADDGWFAGANLAVTIEPGTGTNPNLQALLAGQAQFAAVDLAGAAIARVEQEGFTAIAAIHQRPLAALMAFADSGIRQPYDLAGRRVGLPAGAVTELLFPAYLESAALVEASAVEQVTLEPTALVPALASGQVDAIGQFVVGKPLVEAAGDGRDVVVLPYDEYLDDLYGVGLFTTTALAAADPQLCLRFRDALLSGLQAAIDDSDAAGQALAGHFPETNPEVAAAEMALMAPYCQPARPRQPLGHVDEARLTRHVALLTSVGLLGPNPGLAAADLADFALVPGGQS